MIFMVLSSWQSHCESSPGSFDECRLRAEVAANPQTKPTDLDCESMARQKAQCRLPIILACDRQMDSHTTTASTTLA